MQLKRTTWLWAALLLSTGFFWTGCKEKPPSEAGQPPTQPDTGSEKVPELKPPANPVPVKPWAGQATLKIYYDREPLAAEWIKKWTASSQYHVEQIKLLEEESKPLPTDGDLYIVSPPLVQKLRGLLEWQPPQQLIQLDQIKALFTGHSFDPDNQVSLPWRWSPYVFFRKRNTPEQALPALTFSGWNADEHSAWPEDWTLLWAMKRHLAQGSANAPVNDGEIKAIKALKEQLAGHVFTEEECWKQFVDGKVRNTFALAAWRIKTGHTEDASIEWAVPHQGTLLQFDQLMVPAKSPYAATTGELVKILLSAEGQSELQSLTGYFPVRAGIEINLSPIKLPDGPWMDNSEFLVLDLKALFAEPAAPATPTTTPSVSPSPEH